MGICFETQGGRFTIRAPRASMNKTDLRDIFAVGNRNLYSPKHTYPNTICDHHLSKQNVTLVMANIFHSPHHHRKRYVWLVRNMVTTCSQHAYNMLTTCSQHAHNMPWHHRYVSVHRTTYQHCSSSISKLQISFFHLLHSCERVQFFHLYNTLGNAKARRGGRIENSNQIPETAKGWSKISYERGNRNENLDTNGRGCESPFISN